MQPTTYHQLGRVVVRFQHVEHAVTEIILLLVQGDDEATKILVHDLGYMQRVKVASSLFTRFVELRTNINPDAKRDFYALVTELEGVGQRRNELVHSRYVNWIPLGGAEGLLRTKQRRSTKSPATETTEEEILSESFRCVARRLRANGPQPAPKTADRRCNAPSNGDSAPSSRN